MTHLNETLMDVILPVDRKNSPFQKGAGCDNMTMMTIIQKNHTPTPFDLDKHLKRMRKAQAKRMQRLYEKNKLRE